MYLNALSQLERLVAAVTPTCSRCGKAIPCEDVNVAQDIAYCRACNVSYQLSSLTRGAEVAVSIDTSHPPAGAWYRSEGSETVIGATHRSLGTAFGALLAGLFWNGVISVFVMYALTGTLQHLGVSLPAWFPAPKSAGRPASVGLILFLWVFLIPFMLIGLAIVGTFLSSLGGRTEVRVGDNEAVFFTGLGPVGRRRRFAVSEIRAVKFDVRQWHDRSGDHRRACIVVDMHSGKPFRFGSMLSEERRRFVAASLRKTLKI
jgi:hypothetical protein